MERFLSRFTDQQICINQEDYQRAKRSFHCRYITYIPGVGLDPQRIPQQTPEDIKNKRRELGYPEDAFILMSSGELIRRKNHETILRAIARLRTEGTLPPHLKYVICGHGALEQYLKDLARQLGIDDLVTFAGYREDMAEIYRTADIFIFPSYQEGLPMSLLEAMACGCPVICSDIRGSKDLMGASLSEETGIKCCAGGIMVNRADDVEAYCTAILKMTTTGIDLSAMGQNNQERSRNFYSDKVHARMEKIYRRLLSTPEGK
jgi:glycosyltransferase involved in cell wall biosynthesis